jgi:Fe-S-cluster containining protein
MTEITQTQARTEGSPGGTPVEVPVSLSTAPGRQGGLTFREALEPPCLSCTNSPCCTHLLVSEFKLEGIMDVDYALFLLNFEGIYLGIQRDWLVHVYLHQPCSLLDVPSGLCTVHSTPRQPSVCVHYKSQTCSYRKGMTVSVDADRAMLDYQRMAWLADQIVFDDDRRVSGLPDWEAVLQGFAAIPMDRRPAPVPGPDPVMEEWRAVVLTDKGSSSTTPVHPYSHPAVTDPCSSCGAYCCNLLVFPRPEPATAGQIDFMRYCLGFPSVELGVSDEGWALVVRTTCRHLDGNRCSIYGREDRPLKCRSYDAMNCDHRAKFGIPRPEDILRVDGDRFEVIANALMYDDIGRIAAIPPVRMIRQLVEQVMRAEAAVPDGVSPYQ